MKRYTMTLVFDVMAECVEDAETLVTQAYEHVTDTCNDEDQYGCMYEVAMGDAINGRKIAVQREINADAILKQFCETIEATGGCLIDEDGNMTPVFDEEYIDMGEVYGKACLYLRRNMKVIEDKTVLTSEYDERLRGIS